MSLPATPNAHDFGALEAQSFDAALRRTERAELVERWGALFAAPGATEGAQPSVQARALQSKLELYVGFHDAVVGSRAWRLLQALRRPFGRAW